MCGIGVALCLGFVLNDNFHFPYAAIGFSDFWQRWHMTLSSWLRDYLYIPLGGNRMGPGRTQINLMLTMLLGGLWHGAAWQFIAWGGLHGFYLIGERGIRRAWGERSLGQRSLLPFVLAMVTFVLVTVTWVFFRAQDFTNSFHLLSLMALPTFKHALINRADIVCVLVTTFGLLTVHWLLRDSSLEHAVDRLPWWARSLGLAGLMTCLVLAPGDDRAFIYFQF